MNILITGASGLIGTELTRYFQKKGNQVFQMERSPGDQFAKFYWNPEKKIIRFDNSIPLDLVINLAGANLSSVPWTKAKKQRFLNSRILTTQLLSQKIATLTHKPKLLISASAIGYYGNTIKQKVNESAPPGKGFLADLCQKWEQPVSSAKNSGVRSVNLRMGVVITPKKGLLKKILPLFRIGLGGKLGNGKQIMSWISLSEIGNIISHILQNEAIAGPVNAISPKAVTNDEFTQILARVLHRPALFHIPKFILNLVFGEMAREVLLSSTWAYPEKLIKTGYQFKYPDLQILLKEVCK